jgi:hypothetical protein
VAVQLATILRLQYAALLFVLVLPPLLLRFGTAAGAAALLAAVNVACVPRPLADPPDTRAERRSASCSSVGAGPSTPVEQYALLPALDSPNATPTLVDATGEAS